MLRLYNAKLLPLNHSREILDGEVWIEDSVILYAGRPVRYGAPEFDREIDMRGDLLLPGFKNAHAHGAMNFLRSFADDLPLQSWLFDKVIPYERKLTPEDIYDLQRLADLEYLSAGITSAFEMYYHRDALTQASIDMGYRTVVSGGIDATDDWGAAEMDLLKYNNLHPLISYVPGIHSEYLANLELLMFMRELLDEHKLPFFSHNAETAREVEECRARWDMTPTQLFEEYGLWENGGGGFHCIWFDDRDVEIFREHGLWAVTCPASNAKLASGIFPMVKMQSAGVNVALGTDGPASNNSTDMFREMYLAAILPKLREMDSAACDAATVLEMACCGSARAMNLPDCDSLAPGKQADIICLDLHRPNMRPEHNLIKNIVYSGNVSNVRMTMIAGKILYEDGVFHVGESAEEIYRRADAAARRLTGE